MESKRTLGVRLRTPALAATSLLVFATQAAAAGYKVTNLITDNQSLASGLGYGAAATTDSNLINPWGFARSPTGPWVVANAFGTGNATSYNGAGKVQAPAVTTPQNGGGGPAGPTGAVYGGASGFVLPGGQRGQYFFSNLDGSIAGWDGASSSAQVVVPGRTGDHLAAYTGLAIGKSGGSTYLYGANNITGKIDVFNTSYAEVSLKGNFVDTDTNDTNPGGLLPFNVQNLDGHIWITYAVPGPPADNQPLGSGFVNEFNTDGTFVRRFATGGNLSSPWGIAIAPGDFGAFSNDVLIGNFDDDHPDEAFISAFNATTGQFEGKLEENGAPIELPGLWGLEFGNGAAAGPSNQLFFVAGIGDEMNGLFGSISAVPEPETWLLMIGGFGLIGAQLRRKAAAASPAG